MVESTTRWRQASRLAWWCCSILALLVPALGSAQNALPDVPEMPIVAEGGFLQNQGAQPRFQSASKISPDAVAALRQEQISSIPHFSSSFAFGNRTFPFSVVGTRPQAGGVTRIPTQLVPVAMLFEEFADQNGEPVILDPS